MNFQDLLAKIKSIDESTDVQAQECGAMPVMVGHGAEQMGQPKQQDSVNMNVSMNAAGANGIKDLLDVLRSIEQGGADAGPFSGALETDNDGSEGEALASIDSKDLALDVQPNGDQMLGDKEVGEVSGEVANEPNPAYQSQDFMHDTLSVNKQQQHKHGYRNADNPLAMEGLKAKLQAHYESVKEGYNPNSASAEHRRMLDKHTHDTLKAKAEAENANDADKARYKRYQDRKAAMRAEYDARMER